MEHRIGGFPELVHHCGGGSGGAGVEGGRGEEKLLWKVEEEEEGESGGVYFLHRLTKYGHREMSETQERSLVTDVSSFYFMLTVLSLLHCAPSFIF